MLPDTTTHVRRLVIGVGNRYRQDDGAGIAVARVLQARDDPRVTVRMQQREASDLLDAWAEADQVVVVDAACSGASPGMVHRFDAGAAPLPAELFRVSTHSFGVAEAVELARALGRLPYSLSVYAIEGKVFGQGTGLSPEVEAAVAEVAAWVLQELDGGVSGHAGVNA